MKIMVSPFNSPFELGIRMVYLLSSLFPRKADLQKLVLLDYAVVYSADFGGPESLHTPVPFRGGELYSRRELIQQGLYLMSTKGLVNAINDETGIFFSAGENSRTIVDSIHASYAISLGHRCLWAADRFGDVDSMLLTDQFNEMGHRWGAEVDPGNIAKELK
ncbi:threonine transporter RhtB [Janthinobacterium sp. SUN211]|uniref:ABC-three component system middle component 2 n=1 Tax=Janthinobacterium sp. SUN211 TaxID=3014786 RepID=UPI0027132C7E|nr:ABC-three component system middle component 2 [Janthinobacterium sp. SUN211]MDO8050081.1 threonine transporter RhtB [Janthinobacterium sp. SUN211]